MNKNDYAPIAPMGWNSYDYYDTTVNEEQVRANAAYLAEHLKDAGYEYVVVDIEWYAKKAGSQRNTYQYIPYSELAIDEYSRLQPDPERFPSSLHTKNPTRAGMIKARAQRSASFLFILPIVGLRFLLTP